MVSGMREIFVSFTGLKWERTGCVEYEAILMAICDLDALANDGSKAVGAR